MIRLSAGGVMIGLAGQWSIPLWRAMIGKPLPIDVQSGMAVIGVGLFVWGAIERIVTVGGMLKDRSQNGRELRKRFRQDVKSFGPNALAIFIAFAQAGKSKLFLYSHSEAVNELVRLDYLLREPGLFIYNQPERLWYELAPGLEGELKGTGSRSERSRV